MANSSFAKYPDFLIKSWRPYCGLQKGDFKVFKILLYVKPFNPEDISISTVGRNIIIKGQHDDHFDQHGFTSREFKREYILDEKYDPKSVSSTFKLRGILKVVAYTTCLWNEFMKEEIEMFHGYIDLQPYRLKELSFKIDDRLMKLNAKVIPHAMLKCKDKDIKHRYILPLNVLPDCVHARLNSSCMIEVKGSYASSEKSNLADPTISQQPQTSMLRCEKVIEPLSAFPGPSEELKKEAMDFASIFLAAMKEQGYLE